MTKNIIIKTSVQKRFDSFMAHGRVLFFSAPCGFGKTVLADALLRGRNVLRQSAADPDCAIPPSEQDWDILLIDDLQLMQEEAGQQALCELIRSSTERRFVLLSRGVPPGCLTAFQYTGLMTVLEADDLLFDADDVRRLLRLYGVEAADSEIDGILKESVGYPLGVAITARCMSPGKPWTPELVARVFREVVDITGIALTKLDGTAKGGIVFQVQEELGVPVKLVGLGEGADDLAPFEVEGFVDALLG